MPWTPNWKGKVNHMARTKKSDFENIKHKEHIVSNGEALSDSAETGNKVQPPPFQLKKKTSTLSQSTSTTNSQNAKPPFHVKEKMEDSLGHDFSNVAIHQDSNKAQSLNAKAFTQGNQIHFAPGEYNPHDRSGQELLGHELTHVVQQRENNIPVTTQLRGTAINDNSSLEQEADVKGKQAAEGKKSTKRTNTASKNSVGQPVVQGFIMKSIHKVFKTSIKGVNDEKKYWSKKGKQLGNFGKKMINKVSGSLSIIGDITSFFQRAGSAIQDIISNPIAFVKNLFGSVKEGFLQFFGNITQHVLSGLSDWLFGALGDAGIKIPASFSLKAMLSMAYQILMKTWAAIKLKLIKLIGKKALEFGEDVGKVLSKVIEVGPTAIWNVFKSKITQRYKSKSK